ncbi:MAG: DNA internalization-related competence protein ComEC/Rec2 [Ignavibacteriae bacterium]|nr:DNA internalization-related competence protein ComEC/Rec2 [Ignavibacteriota bacterium]
MRKLETAPAFKIAILFATGVIAGSYIKFSPLVVIILIILQVIFLFYFQKAQRDFKSFLILISLLIFSLGLLKASLDFYYIPGNSVSNIPDTKRNEETKIVGVIQDIPTSDSSRIRFRLGTELLIGRYDTNIISGDILVTLKRNNKTDFNEFLKVRTTENIDYDYRPDLQAGDRILIYGKLSGPFEERNPGEFNYKRYLRLHDIYKIFTVTGYDNIEVINRGNLNFFNREIIYPAREFASGNIDEYIGGDEGAFLKGLVTGERQDISKKVKDDFVKTGVMHIIAVSGLNVAYIILSITLILSLFRVPHFPRVITILVFLLFYCFFTGAPASIIRATVMGSLLLISGIVQRKTNIFNIVGLAVLVILIYDSKQLYDPGFILSFSAVLSMVIIYEKFNEIFLKRINDSKIKYKKAVYNVLGLMLITLAAQAGTLPITTYYFEKISFASLIANAVMVPLSNLSLAIGFFQISSATFSSFISSVIADANYFLLKFQLYFVNTLASFKYSYINFYRFDSVNTVAYFLILGILITAKKRTLKLRLYITAVIIAVLFFINIDYGEKLRITFLYSGQGDCTLLETPDGSTILIDCGTKEFRNNSGESTITPYLKRRGISKIDLLILTHLHNDHIGGIEPILKNFKITKIITNGSSEDSKLKENMYRLITEEHIPVEDMYSGDFIEGYGNLRLYFLNPEQNDSLHINEHTKSIVLKLQYGKVNAVLTGDLSFEGEKIISDSYGNFLRTDILKIPHHGSRNASSVPFLLNCRPEYAVISCGRDNVFGHPSDAVLAKLEILGSKVFRTDKDGAVIFESDGKGVELIKWK